MNKQICLNYSVLKFMESKLTPESSVLEFGAGWSTRWFAERCGYLVSVETSPEWIERVRGELQGVGCVWKVLLVDESELYVRTDKGLVDLVLVDGAEHLRDRCTKMAWPLLRSGGWLVFDDAQRPMHTPTVIRMNKLAKPVRLAWNEAHDIPQAKERVALAWQKPV